MTFLFIFSDLKCYTDTCNISSETFSSDVTLPHSREERFWDLAAVPSTSLITLL